MNAERLLDVYEQISEAPDAIARLRRFVLDLAVRGKLVEQDVADEPASELLKQIDDEKSRLAKAGQIKKQKPLKNISSGEMEFELPTGWAWTRLGEIGQIGSSKRVLQSDWKTAGVPFYRAREIVVLSKFGVVENELFISDKRFEELSQVGHVPESGDIMITGVGTIGIPYVVKDTDRFYFKDASVLIFKNIFSFFTGFMLLLMRSPYWNERVHSESMGTTVHTLTINRANAICLPLPPLAEQHRIVAKVDELMALCDRLEEARKTREEVRDKLTAASLARLTAPDTTPKDFPAHARFALEALPSLTTRPDQIKTLRQTILNLAVRGKLVEQDPADEPAEQLEAEILKALGLKPSKLDLMPQSGLPCLPAGWVNSRIDRLVTVGTGVTPSKGETKYHEGGTVPWVNSADTNEPEIKSATHFVTDVAVSECRLKLYPAGSLVVALYGQGKTRGQVSKLLISATVNQACAVLQFPESYQSIRPYIFLTLQQQYEAMRAMAEGGAQPNLNLGKIKSRIVPLPPLAEQHRIVAKVDALMALCDRLEAALTSADTTRTRLLEALLHEALDPANDTLEAAE